MKKIAAFVAFLIFAFPVFSKQKTLHVLHDGYLNVDYQVEPYCVLSRDFLKIECFGKSGTFNIYCAASDKKEKPLLSTADLSSSTGFLVKMDETLYNLNKDRRVLRELRKLDDSVQLVYTIEEDVRLIVDMSLASSQNNLKFDIIKISAYIINISGKNHTVGFKGIFDTACGEVSSVHFTTDSGIKIRNETCFSARDLQKERTVSSSDSDVSYQFVLDGIKVSPVESVILANIDELYRMKWDAVIRKGRGFTNNKAYDNSGIMIKWPDFELKADSKVENTFYIACANNGEVPQGLYYVDKVLLDAPVENNEEKPAEDNKNDNLDKRTDVEFIIPPIKDYQLDPGYIQDLIDRIDALQSSENVDQKTVTRLNAELDAILEKLRRQ